MADDGKLMLADAPALGTVATAAFHGAAERYTDWRSIGGGGSAEVWQVHDRDLGIPLAIKLLRPRFTTDPMQIDALRREVLISRALRHPHICPIHDLYEGPRGVGVVMDLLLGQDLSQWATAHRGRLLDTLGARIAVLHRIADALATAHRRIIHRDLKPANVFLHDGDIGRPLIMDFGLSVLGGAVEQRFVGGTPKYMAPEQYLAPGSVDRRADLFSLGVLAYELLSDGHLPANSLRDILRTRTVPRLPAGAILTLTTFCGAIPPAVDRIVRQMLDSDPDGRPASAETVRDTLAGAEALPARRALSGGRPAPDFVAIAPGASDVGSRRMGDSPREKPRRRLMLAGFAIAPTPVTNADYAAFRAATGYRPPAFAHDPRFALADAPVVGVNWADAAAYAEWAGARLPTEVEWETAARAGRADEYPWGPTPPEPGQANIDRTCDAPTPVTSHPGARNPIGLWDMGGNVWEWCADTWEEHLYRRVEDGALAPVGRGAGQLRAIRGGSFDSFGPTGRCAFRGCAPADEARADIGFRLARSLPA